MNNPFFSVIIPTFNRAEKLRRALDSLLEQSWRDFEVIVCDDGSIDGTGEMVGSFVGRLDIRHLWDENFGGPARPRNRGVTASRGEWLCFLDADDWWYPLKLERVAAVTGDADFIFHDCDVVTPEGVRRFVRKSMQPKSPVFADFMTRGCRVITSSVCVRRGILERTGPFTEEREFIAVEDTDLWLRVARETERFIYLPERLGAYWEDGTNISVFSDKYISRVTALHEKFAPLLEPGDRREAELLLAYRTAIVMRALGQTAESRDLFRKTVSSRNLKIRLYSLYYLARLAAGR